MQPRGQIETMQTPTAHSAWCGDFHRVQELATQGVRWLFGCLPCVKGNHRVHPTILELSDALYITINGNKRLRVLHTVPDADTSTLIKTNVDQTDLGDRCSLDSSGEDYWFMRWNRPIRPNLQRNSCSCSFRKSQIKSSSDVKNSKTISENTESIVSPSESKDPISSHPLEVSSVKVGLDSLAEQLSQDILIEAILKSSKIKTNKCIEKELKSTSKTSSEKISQKCCNNICVGNVKLTIEEQGAKFGSYVNPMFIASNDALDLIPSNSAQVNSCGKQVDEESIKSSALRTHSKAEFPDYNANDQNLHSVEERNALNRKSTPQSSDDHGDKKKHRKSCLNGVKTYLKKPLLLLIHGAGSNCDVWKNLICHLVQDGYECVAPDLLGHGLSSAPDKASYYTFHAYLQDLLCIFDRFVADGRTAVILGHGYGCSLAAAIARYRQEQVTQLVLISGGGPTPLAPRNPPSVSPCLRACLEPLLMCGFKRDVVYSVCGKQMEPCSPETSGVPRHIVDYISQGHVWPEGDAAFHRRIVAPTLLVHGMRDQHITLVQQCEMERTIPRSFLEVIPEAGHWAMLETPTHLSHMILCFIDWWAPPNRTQ